MKIILQKELSRYGQTISFDHAGLGLSSKTDSPRSIVHLLDAGSPEFYRTDAESKAKVINRCAAILRTLGITRFLGICDVMLPLYGEDVRSKNLPQFLKQIDKTMYYQHAGSPTSLKTLDRMNENASAILRGPRLDSIPILVRSSDSGIAWEQTQRQLASWSQNSTQQTIKNATHYIYWSNYDEVMAAIVTFLQTHDLTSPSLIFD